MTMTNNDILRAAAGLRAILEEAYPGRRGYPATEMDIRYKERKDVPTRIQVRHLKYELERIQLFLKEGTASKRERAFRWLSNVGGMMRSNEFKLVSIADLGNLFRPEIDDPRNDSSP